MDSSCQADCAFQFCVEDGLHCAAFYRSDVGWKLDDNLELGVGAGGERDWVDLDSEYLQLPAQFVHIILRGLVSPALVYPNFVCRFFSDSQQTPVYI